MTDSVALPGVIRRTPPPAFQRSAAPRLPVTDRASGGEKKSDRRPLFVRMLRSAFHRQLAAVPLDRQNGSGGAAQVALAAAVRQQLTNPGSVPPQRQLQLILADRAVPHDDRVSSAPDEYQWNPFLSLSDVNPHRPLAGIKGAPDRAPRYAWWDRPFQDFSTS